MSCFLACYVSVFGFILPSLPSSLPHLLSLCVAVVLVWSAVQWVACSLSRARLTNCCGTLVAWPWTSRTHSLGSDFEDVSKSFLSSTAHLAPSHVSLPCCPPVASFREVASCYFWLQIVCRVPLFVSKLPSKSHYPNKQEWMVTSRRGLRAASFFRLGFPKLYEPQIILETACQVSHTLRACVCEVTFLRSVAQAAYKSDFIKTFIFLHVAAPYVIMVHIL